jgi:hypothetical protein
MSDFHDYYDGLATFDKADRVYVRRQVDHIIKLKTYGKGSGLHDLCWRFLVGTAPDIINGRRVYRSLSAFYEILGVCGKVYPLIRYEWNKENVYFNNLDDLESYLVSKDVDVKIRSGYMNNIPPKEWMRRFEENALLRGEFFISYGTPIYHFREVGGSFDKGVPVRRDSVLTTNAKLLDFNFQKIKDAYQVYQDIDTYLGNELAVNKNMPDSTGDDVDLAKAKGFDKWSFRKESKVVR